MRSLYAVKKHQRLVYGVYLRTPIYPNWNQSKIWGAGQDLGGGPVPPWPQPKTATGLLINPEAPLCAYPHCYSICQIELGYVRTTSAYVYAKLKRLGIFVV